MDQQPTQSDLIAGLRRSATIIQSLKQEIAGYHEPIAIIGMGCRFPGAANPAALWQLLCDGVDAIGEVPSNRWPLETLYTDTLTPGKMTTRWGGFLSEIDQFDPLFFGISPLEATYIDPQQRLLLETSWEALEGAGLAPDTLAGSATGVFVGICTNDYSHLSDDQQERTHAYAGAGNALSIAANRISYLLDLRGPSMAIDTACSSSLVALHTACRSLRHGECQLALAGGVNLILSPEGTIIFSQAGMMSMDGRCKTFDAQADGYVRGEGCGVIVLKRLSDAQRAGDPILAVIRGSAINQDGRTNGLTAPSSLSQQAVIRAALADAKVTAEEISYVEAHGTGTPLGDPIEVNALKAVLLPGRPPEAQCWLGSVKTNIGHLEAAAGIAGVIKVVLALQHGELPRHLHLHALNPHIQLDGSALTIPAHHQPWLPHQGKRIAGVSSFGFGGANAHVIIEEAPPAATSTTPNNNSERPRHLLTVSAKHPVALRQLATRYAEQLTAQSNPLADFCFTANTGRNHSRHRLALTAASAEEAITKLAAFGTDTKQAGLVHGEVAANSRPRLAFLFTGQGSQTVNMGRQLYATQPTFRAVLDQCDALLQPLLGRSLLAILYPPAGDESAMAAILQQTAYTQPALFALEYALASLWRAWGLEPDVVIGHSLGEYVAACIAGVFSLADGLKLVAERGRLMGALPEAGTMATIFAPEAQVAALLESHEGQVTIAALNGPANTVISGPLRAVETVLATCAQQGLKMRKLQVSHAFHSPLMAPMLPAFDQLASQVTYHAPTIPFIANVTGERFAQGECPDADYWHRHTLAPVRFATGIGSLIGQEQTLFLEIGPKPVLTLLGEQLDPAAQWLPSLAVGQSDWEVLLNSAATLYAHGLSLDWASFDHDYARRRCVLPTYPFQRQRYWISEGIPTMTVQTTTSMQTTVPARQQQFAEEVQKLIATTLKLQPADLPLTTTLLEVGADSLALVTAVRAIESTFNVNIGIRRFFEDLATIEAISAYLDQVLPAQQPSQTQAAQTPTANVSTALQPQPAAQVSQPLAMPVPATANGHQRQSPNLPPVAVVAPSSRMGSMLQGHEAVNAGSVERIIQAQIQLMGQQLELMRGAQQPDVITTGVTTTGVTTTVGPQTPIYVQTTDDMPTNGHVKETYAYENGHSYHNGHVQEARQELTRPQLQPEQRTEERSNGLPVKAKSAPTTPAQAIGPWRPPQTQKSNLSPKQQQHLDALIARYNARTHRSKELTQRFRPVLADSRVVVGFRASVKEMTYPIVGERGQGAHFWDVDGNEYIDLTMGFGVLLFGHAAPFLQQALIEQHQLGVELGPQFTLAGEVAELVAELTGMERVTFCNSGTEAVMAAIRLARAATGRTKIAHFAGSYHGHSDMTLGMATDGNNDPRATSFLPGISPNIMADALVVEYGNMHSLEIIRAHAHELAAVLVEPIQSRRPELQPVEFVHALRQLTEETGIILIFDEMISGFRIHPGGAQAWYGVKADLATYGKIAGGGMPIGIIAGKASIMNYIDGGMWQYGDDSVPSKETVFFGGTFCKHPLAMATAKAALTQVKALGLAAYEQLNRRTADFAATLNTYFEAEAVPIRVVHWGSLFLFRFQSNLEVFFFHLLEKGIFMWEWRSCFFSLAHTDEDIAYVIAAVKATVEELRAGDFLAQAPTGKGATGGGMVFQAAMPTVLPAARVPASQSVTLPAINRTKQIVPKQAQAAAQSKTPAAVDTMRFSLYYFGAYGAAYEADKYDLLFEGARFADAHGLDAIWVPERHFHAFGGFSPNPSVLCAALARETTQIQLRAGSVVLPLHHPVRIVEEWSVVDNLSDGRVGLSVASGWHPNDFVLAPAAFGNHRDQMFSEIETLRRLWRGEALTFPNGAGEPTAVQVFPMPKQRDVPIYVTIVRNADTYIRAGEVGAGVLTNLMGQSLEELATNIALYRAARAKAGYDPATGQVVVLMHTYIGEDLATVRALARQPLCDYMRTTIDLFKSMAVTMGLGHNFAALTPDEQNDFLALVYDRYVEDRALIGTVASCAKIVEHLQTLGVNEIACFVDFGVEPTAVRAAFSQIDALQTQVQSQNRLAAPSAVTAAQHGVNSHLLPQQTAPLSAAQRQLWILAQLGDAAAAAYNEFIALRLCGALHVPSLQQALQQMVGRHEALRTTFDALGEYQLISAAMPFDLTIVDLSTTPAIDQPAAITAWFQAESARPFDLKLGPLFTAYLLQLSAQEHLLALKAHHIILDGWSWGIIVQEVSTLYAARYAGTWHELPQTLQFREFANQQQAQRSSSAMLAHETYWLQQFADTIPVLELPSPTRSELARTPHYQAARLTIRLDAQQVTALKSFSKQQRSTLFMTLFAAYTTLLYRLSGQNDFVVGTPVSGRFDDASSDLVGYCTHLLPIRNQIDGQANFITHLAQTRRRLLDGYDHEIYPFAWLLEALHERRVEHRSALIKTIFNLDRALKLPAFGSVASELYTLPRQAVAFELVFNAMEINQEIFIDCDYNRGLFDEATIQRWLGHFQTLLAAIVADPSQSLCSLPLLTTAERQQLLVAWAVTDTTNNDTANNDTANNDKTNNDTASSDPTKCIHQLFEEQVTHRPDAVALAFADQTLTYAQLNARANQLAHYLESLGVGPEVLVGLCVERSLETVVGFLGILKAGGVYVPLDPTYPPERLSFIINDAAPAVIVTQRQYQAQVAAAARLVLLDDDATLLAEQPIICPPNLVTPANLAYVIYTSGSTGQPKGVLLEQRGLTNLAQAQIAAFGVQPGHRVLQAASLNFDASISEIVMALAAGATLVLADTADLLPGPALTRVLQQQAVTHVTLVPTALALLEPTELPDLQTLIVAGEACPATLLARWTVGRRAFNAYGPTEITVCATIMDCADWHDQQQPPPIGRPLTNTQIYLLDQQGQPVPIGLPGELYVGGVGVGRGYLNQPGLTAAKFIANPFAKLGTGILGAERLYRTGDLACWLPDGNLAFLGRVDDQVKLRGFRIELSEIEATLNQHPAIRESVVLVDGTEPTHKRLRAFFVAQATVTASELLPFLRAKLPDYMVPATFVALDSLPLTPNGKLDRRAILAHEAPDLLAEEHLVAPSTPTERTLAAIWEEVLRRTPIGVSHDFFALGGHSLMVTQVISRINTTFAIDLPIRTLFERPTIAELAEQITLVQSAQRLQGHETAMRSTRREEIVL